MRPGRTAWTPHDDALLRMLVRQRKSTATMVPLLNRTPKAIYSRISRLRLITRNNKRSGMTDEHFRMNLRRLCLNPI